MIWVCLGDLVEGTLSFWCIFYFFVCHGRCRDGFVGSRCEKYLCANYCHNGGFCIIRDNHPLCLWVTQLENGSGCFYCDHGVTEFLVNKDKLHWGSFRTWRQEKYLASELSKSSFVWLFPLNCIPSEIEIWGWWCHFGLMTSLSTLSAVFLTDDISIFCLTTLVWCKNITASVICKWSRLILFFMALRYLLTVQLLSLLNFQCLRARTHAHV